MEQLAQNVYLQLGAIGLVIILLGYLAWYFKSEYTKMKDLYMSHVPEMTSIMKDVIKSNERSLDKEDYAKEKTIEILHKLDNISNQIQSLRNG